MPWFRVDDGLADHPKVLGIPKRDRAAAMGLWALAGSWSAAHLTDGLVPEYLPEHLGCPKRLAAVLVEAGLWSAEAQPDVGRGSAEAQPDVGRGSAEARGWRFHAWAERQPSREQVEAERLASKERQQRWRDRAKQNRRSEQVSEDTSRRYEQGDDGVTNGAVTLPPETSTLPDPSLPDPTRPLPTEEEPPTDYVSRGARKRATRLPEPFPVTAEMAAWAAENAPNVGTRDHDQFCDYWRGKSGKDGTKLDWVATWRNWMRKESDRRDGGSSGLRRGPGPGPGPDQRAADVARLAAELQARHDGTTPHLRAIGE